MALAFNISHRHHPKGLKTLGTFGQLAVPQVPLEHSLQLLIHPAPFNRPLLCLRLCHPTCCTISSTMNSTACPPLCHSSDNVDNVDDPISASCIAMLGAGFGAASCPCTLLCGAGAHTTAQLRSSDRMLQGSIRVCHRWQP